MDFLAVASKKKRVSIRMAGGHQKRATKTSSHETEGFVP